MLRPRPATLVVVLTVFTATTVGATSAVLLLRYRAAALGAVSDRHAVIVSLRAKLIGGEVDRLRTEMTRLSQLAEIDLADRDLEPEKSVLRVARRDTVVFSAAILILDALGDVLWSEPAQARLASGAAALVGLARAQGRTIVHFDEGEIDVAAPIPSQGAIVGRVSTGGHDVFGDELLRAVRPGGRVELVARTGREIVVASAGGAPPQGIGPAGESAWRSDARGGRWLVREAAIGDGPLLLRLALPQESVLREVSGPVRSLAAVAAVALLLAVAGGGLLALAIARLERADVEVERSRELAGMGRTAAAIAHEVKNSLNGLSVALDLLATGRTSAAVAREVHQQARSEIARLRGVADDLTLFAAPPRLQLGQLDLADLCRRAVASAADLAADCGVRIVLRPADDAPMGMTGDPQKLLGAIQNVVRNGVEAMGPGAFDEALGASPARRERTLEVGLERGEEHATVEIADRGPGIAPEVRGRLFDPFVSTKRTGTGLGLAIARRVVEAHGGVIAAAPRAGGGTVFRLVLPVDVRDPAWRPQGASEAAS